MAFWVSLLFLASSFFPSFADQKSNEKKASKLPMDFHLGELHGRFQLKYKPETFFLKNVNLLNNFVDADRIYLSRSTLDLNYSLAYKNPEGKAIGEMFSSVRNKAVWGNPESIAQTTESGIKLLEAVFGEHKHFITRHVMWIREMWFKFSLEEALNLGLKNHYFTLGSFPFNLGRGIALGDAFAVGPRVLGFYSDNAIDQYAFGFKFSGNVISSKISYDLYGAILENKGDSFTNTGAKIRGQQFGHKFKQERGAGNINFITAVRMKMYPIQNKCYSVALEPYALYNNAPEQRLEFPSDANSKLGTFGFAGEFIINRFEWGFDAAANVGRQKVFGWDRNIIEFENRTQTVAGSSIQTIVLSNSQVRQNSATGPKVIYVPRSAVQALINTSAQDASQNGQLIGTVDGVNYYNSINRFRNPYTNVYQGWMVVADGAYSLNESKTFKVAATVGATSGDRNPNQDLDRPGESQIDGNFKGFIPLQELYSGYRVQSAFFLGGTGKAPRPLFIPTEDTVLDRLPTQVSGFTNLIFTGAAIHWFPKFGDRSLNMRPNLLWYWQETSTNAWDRAAGEASTRMARNYLGFEANVFFDAELFQDFKGFVVGSVFVPGAHYKDIKGSPLTRDDLKVLDSQDVTGIVDEANPFISDNIAYTLNIGLECRF